MATPQPPQSGNLFLKWEPRTPQKNWPKSPKARLARRMPGRKHPDARVVADGGGRDAILSRVLSRALRMKLRTVGPPKGPGNEFLSWGRGGGPGRSVQDWDTGVGTAWAGILESRARVKLGWVGLSVKGGGSR